MRKRLQPTIRPQVEEIYRKLQGDRTGKNLSRKERQLEVSKIEAAHLLSVLAGRTIDPEYIRQITRGEKPRLTPSQAVGNTYLFTVDSLLQVKFTKPHQDTIKQPSN